MWGLTPTHLIIVLIAFLVLFGAGKLPAAARGLGQSLRVFKSEMREMRHDSNYEHSEKAVNSAADQSSENKTI